MMSMLNFITIMKYGVTSIQPRMCPHETVLDFRRTLTKHDVRVGLASLAILVIGLQFGPSYHYRCNAFRFSHNEGHWPSQLMTTHGAHTTLGQPFVQTLSMKRMCAWQCLQYVTSRKVFQTDVTTACFCNCWKGPCWKVDRLTGSWSPICINCCFLGYSGLKQIRITPLSIELLAWHVVQFRLIQQQDMARTHTK